MLDRLSIDKNKLVVFGFETAGWDRFRLQMEKVKSTVYTTSNPILAKDKSIYMTSHSLEILKTKSQASEKKKDEKSVISALSMVLGNLYENLKTQGVREKIVKLVWDTLAIDEQELKETLAEIEKAGNPNQAMLDEMLARVTDDDLDKDLQGYRFIRILQSILSNSPKWLDGGYKDENALKLLKDQIRWVDLETTPLDIQISLAASKGMLVDALQENLRLLSRGQPLIPIYFVVASEREGEMKFDPNWVDVIKKVGISHTNAEIRMAYKLMLEIDDLLINAIMEKIVSFYKETKNGFELIKLPWMETDESKSAWEKRVRSGNKLSYKMRKEESIQPWIKELKKLSATTIKDIEESAKKSTAVRWHEDKAQEISKGHEVKIEEKIKDKLILVLTQYKNDLQEQRGKYCFGICSKDNSNAIRLLNELAAEVKNGKKSHDICKQLHAENPKIYTALQKEYSDILPMVGTIKSAATEEIKKAKTSGR